MPTLTFHGTVYPAHPLSFRTYPPITWENIETGEKETFTVRSHESAIDVVIELDRYHPADVDRHRNKAIDVSQAAVNVTCFQNGWGFTGSLERYVDPEGLLVNIVPGHPELSRFVLYTDRELADIFSLLVGEPYLQMALDDLISAITKPHLAAINCARSVEGIRTLISKEPRAKAWPIMRAALNLEESYTRPITEMSQAPRHGDRK